MNYIIRPLDASKDEVELISLFKSNPTTLLMQRSPGLIDEMISMIPTLINNPLYFTLVTELDGELTGILCAKEFEFQPAWTWGYWMHKPGKLTSIWLEDGFKITKMLTDQLFEEMEDRRKLNRFFWSFPDDQNEVGVKKAGSMDRLLASNIGVKLMPRARNYTFFDDCFIPVGTMPKYPYQQAIAGNRIQDVDIRIRMGVLNDSAKEINHVG